MEHRCGDLKALTMLRLQAGPARIVAVSSSAHMMGDLDLDDLHYRKRPYSPWASYGQSKLANVLFAKELTRRWAPHTLQAT